MGLTACPSCEGQVSIQAALCPKCGHQFKTPGSLNLQDPVHLVGLVIIAISVLGGAVYLLRAVWTGV